MSERIALITGGARGIGRAIGLDLARAGWGVAFCYRSSVKEAEDTVAAIRSISAKASALPIKADVSDHREVEKLVGKVEAELGRIDALINCAGPYERAKILEETPEGWRAMFANNLDPVFYTAKYAAAGMIRRKWGRIVSFSMASADRIAANNTVTAHFIAKSGVLSLSRALAKELAPHGVTVNCVSPGFIDSKSAPEDELQAMKKNIPAGYVGTTDDAVGAVRYLLSDEARYVTGANLILSGGWGL